MVTPEPVIGGKRGASLQASQVAAATGDTIRAISTSWSAVSPRVRAQSIAGLAAILAASAVIMALPIDYHALGNYGYIGVFGVTLISTASLILPVPYLATIFVAGSFLDPRMVALVAGCAAALGELTGYALGYTGRRLIPQNPWYSTIQRAMRRWGSLVIFGGSVVPNPFFDALGMVAGATRMPVWVFLTAAFLGKSLRFLLIAALGGAFIGR